MPIHQGTMHTHTHTHSDCNNLYTSIHLMCTSLACGKKIKVSEGNKCRHGPKGFFFYLSCLVSLSGTGLFCLFVCLPVCLFKPHISSRSAQEAITCMGFYTINHRPLLALGSNYRYPGVSLLDKLMS